MSKYYRHYREWVGLDKRDAGDKRRFQKVMQLVQDSPGTELLDVGCYDGELTKRFALLGKRVYGVDFLRKAVTHARKLGVFAFQADVSKKIPFGDGYFDVVVMGELIEHMLDPDALLAEANRVLRKKGSLVITTPNLARLNNRLRLLAGKYPLYLEFRHKDNFHLHLFTFRALRYTLEQNGFDVVSEDSNQIQLPGVGVVPPWVPELGDIIVIRAIKKRLPNYVPPFTRID